MFFFFLEWKQEGTHVHMSHEVVQPALHFLHIVFFFFLFSKHASYDYFDS